MTLLVHTTELASRYLVILDTIHELVQLPNMSFLHWGGPLIPCACWRISSERVYPTIDDGYSRKEKKDFIVYGSEKIYFLEFFSIMLLTWSGTAAIIIAFIIFIMMIS